MTACDAGDALLADFTARLGYLGSVTCKRTPWHSATFAGERHELSFTVTDRANLGDFVRTIGHTSIALRRGFVADVAVVETRALPEGARLRVEVLTIDDA